MFIRRILNAVRNRFKAKSIFDYRTRNEIEKIGFKHAGAELSIPFFSNLIGSKYISIGDNFSALWNLRLEAYDAYEGERFNPVIEIGNHVHLNSDVHIGAIDKIKIGNNVLMASRIYISDHSHGEISAASLLLPPHKRPLTSKGPVIIEDNVWIGEGVCILPGVTIGRNSIIGANAVVTKSVPANAVVGGIPARVLKMIEE